MRRWLSYVGMADFVDHAEAASKLNFFTGKDEGKHFGKSAKVENGTLAEEADWGSRLATFHGETNQSEQCSKP